MASSEFKACCASLYEEKVLRFLLGPSLHPGGLDLTRRLAEKVRLCPTDFVLDLACGAGETPQFLTREYGCRVHGVDLSSKLVGEAATASEGRDVDFSIGDAENLPFRGNAFTAVISECSMCLLPGLKEGLGEVLRVLRQGGRFGVTDVVTRGPLPSELEAVLMSLLCISQRISWSEYRELVEGAGFQQVVTYEETGSLSFLLEGIRKRLLLAELLVGVGKIELQAAQLAKGKRLVSLARKAVDEGTLGYLMLTAQKL